METVADRFDVTRHIELGKNVEKATWDEEQHKWVVELGDGEVRQHSLYYLVHKS